MANGETPIILGDVYRDDQTGYEGVATSLHTYQYACQRVTLEAYNPKTQDVRELTFDAPRLTHVKSNKKVKTKKTGGPARAGERRPSAERTLS